MKKKATFEGYIYHDMSSARNPVKIILDEKSKPIKLLEHMLSSSGVIPKIITEHASKRYGGAYKKDAQVVAGEAHVVARETVLREVKKVRMTVTVEEI